jgi:signal transduction histidine kinase
VTKGSLKLRLLLVSGLTIAFALLLALFALDAIFRQHVEARVRSEMENHLWQLIDAVSFEDADTLKIVKPLADPRFERPLSGLYWQISIAGKPVANSQSLWDQNLSVPEADPAAPATWLTIPGPEDSRLAAMARTIKMQGLNTTHALQVLIAIDRREIEGAVRDFDRELMMSLGVIAILLGAGAFLQAHLGLQPLKGMAEKLKNLREGETRRLEAPGPDEVRPLVDEVNALLTDQEASIARARARAGDLAHGLKTPLTVLNSVARQIEAGKVNGAAADIREQTGLMDRHVQRQLAITRLAPDRRYAATPVRPLIEKIAASMKRLPGGDAIAWNVAVPPAASLAADPDDLMEVVGNLADNARKYANCAVTVSFEQRGDHSILSFEDDGPGVPAEKLQTVLERGTRLDTSRPGSGLGLAIVSDVCAAYGWKFALAKAGSGGLRAEITATARSAQRGSAAAEVERRPG